jgi:amino acid adenylation domain-containing protein
MTMSRTKSAKAAATPVDYDPFAGEKILFTAPTTESQKEIWTSVQMGDDANCAYNESVSLLFKGNLDCEALRHAFVRLVDRHDALRTLFGSDGKTLCVTAAPATIDIPLVDLSSLDERARRTKLASMLGAAVETPFDLQQGPLFRAGIVKLDKDDYQLVFTAHHIICDGWSAGVILPELGECYSAHRKGTEPALPPAFQFSDYAKGQEAYQKSQEHADAVAFWDRQFAVLPPALDLPTDNPRPPFRSFASLREDMILDSALVGGLKRVGAKAGCSFFVTMLAAFQAYLNRLTEQDDVVVGIPAAGQAVTDHDRLVGHCVNLLPIRTRIDSNGSFSEVMKSVKTLMLDAYDNQQYTYGSLLKRLALPRDPSRIPLVSVLFNIDQGLNVDLIKFEGLATRFASNPRLFENFELFINALESGGKLVLECQYNINLFAAETVRRRLEGFKVLLEGVVADPDRPIALLPLLTPAEHQLLASWNKTAAPPAESMCLHQLFEAQVEQTPAADAILFINERISYSDLNKRANRVAHRLRTLGVGPETLVGICMERSVQMVVAMIGILKAGGAYVPVDPKYPKDRVAFMLEDSRATVIITQDQFIEQLPKEGVKILCLDAGGEVVASESDKNPPPSARPTDLAYIIYTSGSTGRPKGVAIEHHCPVALVQWAQTVFSDTELSGVLASTSICFDLSVFELFVTLASGGTVILAENVLALPTLPARDKVVLVNSVPSAVSELLSGGELPSSVVTVNLAGEPLTAALVNKLYGFPAVKRVYDLYGPSEDTTYSTFALRKANGPQTIGRPLPGTVAYILDGRMQPVPLGVTGELYLGGAKLARGYLNRPELTSERFLRDPFSSDPASRMYKTGDRARFFSDGNIEFLGRLDFQVKVRGFRIELGEIESVLLEIPSIKQVAVTVIERKPGDVRIVTFIVVAQGPAFDQPAARNHARVKLPEYMVPQHFVVLDALPLTPTKKIDRKKLPSLFTVDEPSTGHYIAPATDIQKSLAAIWQEVLGLSRIGIHDNFFDIGGHSLLVTQIISRIRRDLALDFTMRLFFEMPTIAQQATFLEAVQNVRQAGPKAGAVPSDREEIEL